MLDPSTVMRTVLRAATAVLWVALSAGEALPGDSVASPIRLSADGVLAGGPDLTAPGTAVIVAFVEDGSLKVGVPWSGSFSPVAEPVTAEARPRIAAEARGRVAVLFQGPAALDPGALDLWIVERDSGTFGAPRRLNAALRSPSRYCLSYASRGVLGLLWEAPSEPSLPDVVLERDGLRAAVARGEAPEIVADPAGFLHLAYVQDGRVRYRSDRLDGDLSTEVEVPAPEPVFSIALAAGSAGADLLESTESGLWHVRVNGATPGTPVRVTGSADLPRIVATPDGRLAATFLRGGSLVLVRGDAAGAFEPEGPLPGTSGLGPVTDQDLTLDDRGFLHVVLEAGGGVWYWNDVPPPEPAFVASAETALAGDPIAFEDRSSGWILRWSWDFGDGTGSSDPSPTHRYLASGAYRPALTVTGPGGTRTVEASAPLMVAPPTNVLELPRIPARAGDRQVTARVLLTSGIATKGFELVLRAPPGIVLRGASVRGTETEAMAAELFRADLHEDGDAQVLTVAALWDYDAPLDGRVLRPISRRPLLLVELDVAESAVPGDRLPLRFLETWGAQEKRNLLVSAEDVVSVFPLTLDGEVEIAPADRPAFARGDANLDGDLDLSDAIFVLVHLFSGGGTPACPDAADLNDDGTVDVSDPIFLLAHLFLVKGELPPYPYPGPGLDPTPDELGPCDVVSDR